MRSEGLDFNLAGSQPRRTGSPHTNPSQLSHPGLALPSYVRHAPALYCGTLLWSSLLIGL